MERRGQPGEHPRVSWEQVVSFRLARHHLLQRAPSSALSSVTIDMAGVQAQVLSAAGISLWARVRDLRREDVAAALGKERTLVRAWCMRRTVHLLPSHELSIFVRGSSRRAEKEVRWVLKQGVPGRVLQDAMDAVLGALDQPQTRSELGDRVGRSLGVPVRMREGGGWGNRTKIPWVKVGLLKLPVDYLFHLAGAYGVICSGPSQGNQPTFVRADAWIPGWRDMPVDQAERELLRRYLRSFGPATPKDFAFWSGMRVGDAQEVWASLGPAIVPVDMEGRKAGLLRRDLQELRSSAFEESPPRLLPYFDSFLLGSLEKEHLVETQHKTKVFRNQGWISPVLLLGGRIHGTWTHARGGKGLHVRVLPFTRLSREVPSEIQKEGRNLGRYLGLPKVEISILPTT